MNASTGRFHFAADGPRRTRYTAWSGRSKVRVDPSRFQVAGWHWQSQVAPVIRAAKQARRSAASLAANPKRCKHRRRGTLGGWHWLCQCFVNLANMSPRLSMGCSYFYPQVDATSTDEKHWQSQWHAPSVARHPAVAQFLNLNRASPSGSMTGGETLPGSSRAAGGSLKTRRREHGRAGNPMLEK